MQNRLIRWISYFVFAMLVTVMTIYLRFPTAEVKSMAIQLVEQQFPGVSCAVGRLGYVFPATITLDSFSLASSLTKTKFLQLKKVRITPKLGSIGEQFHVSSQGYAGAQSFDLFFADNWTTFSLQDVKITNLDLTRTALAKMVGRKITGILDLQGRYSASIDAPGAGSGDADIMLSEANFELLYPVLYLDSIDIEESNMTVNFANSMLIFSDGRFSGKELKGLFSGTVVIEEPMSNSAIELSGSLTARQFLLNSNQQAQSMIKRLQSANGDVALPFQVEGGLEKIKFSFVAPGQ